MSNLSRYFRLRYWFEADNRVYSTVITAISEDAADIVGREYAEKMAGTMNKKLHRFETEPLQSI